MACDLSGLSVKTNLYCHSKRMLHACLFKGKNGSNPIC